MRASVIICTYNRHELLKSSITSIFSQSFPHEQFEIVVVDNNSSDFTRQTIEALSASAPVRLRYIFEAQQGLSFARNRGIQEAAGDVIVFCDDDIEADENWLTGIVAVFDDPCVAAAGGAIKPVWLSARPPWLPDTMLDYLAVSDFPKAAKTGEFETPDMPFGANIAFRKDVFDQVGVFPTHLGRIGNRLLSNEETEICLRVLAKGYRIRFAHNAVVGHKIDPQRLTKKWFYRRHYWQGRSDLLLDQNQKQSVHGKIRTIMLQFRELERNRLWLSFEQRFRYYWLLGYLHQMIFADMDVKYDNIRNLAAILNSYRLLADHNDCISVQSNLTARINALTNSLSWRLTSPLRFFKDRLDAFLR